MNLSNSSSWLPFVGLTVLMWGSYGVLLHQGQLHMGDPEMGRYKAFFFVGIAYLLVGVLAPGILMLAKGADWAFTPAGIGWSLVAGTAGAVGAFGVLLAFGAKGTPAAVMSLIFAGAPIVNAIISLTMQRMWNDVRWPFLLGIVLASVGAFLVVAYKPVPAKQPAPQESPSNPR